MNETALLIGALAVVILIVILYVALKDRETSRKLSMMEAGIEALNREIFKISKELESIEQSMKDSRSEVLGGAEEHEPVDRIVNKKLKPFVLEVDHLRERVEEIREYMERIDRLDEKMRQMIFANEHTAPDEQKILQLHAKGMDSESIAKQLRLGKGEVELVLKFSRLNSG